MQKHGDTRDYRKLRKEQPLCLVRAQVKGVQKICQEG